MENLYFIYEGIKHLIVLNNSRIQILKVINDKNIELSKKEYDNLYKLLYGKYSYKYESINLIEALKTNQNIENKDYVSNFLDYLESIIPINYRDNLYRNIKTLKTNLNINAIFDKSSSNDNIIRIGSYDAGNNTLSIGVESMKKIYEIAKTTSNPLDFYWRHYSCTLLHELSHMASTKFNKETRESLCGFDRFPPKKYEDRNRGLTEGFTEFIAFSGVPGTVEESSKYFYETSLVAQMINIVGIDPFIKGYFNNEGIKPIKDELNSLIDDSTKSYNYFRLMELNYNISSHCSENNIVGFLQSTLLDYLDVKLSKEEDINVIKNTLDKYGNVLITPEKIALIGIDPNKDAELDESIKKYLSIKEKYSVFNSTVSTKAVL